MSQWLTGKRNPSVENLLKVAAACGMEFTMSVGDGDEPPASGQ